MENVEMGLNQVIEEFGKVFAKGIPKGERNMVVRAAALSWLSEQMTTAVQNKTKYKECDDIEQANNVVRFAHGGIVRDYPDDFPRMNAIFNGKWPYLKEV